jgi:cell division septation protein DedD/nucleoid DNA-binding protein
MLSKFVQILLNQNGRVIIPDFGALILKGDEDNSIYFNEYLRFNDGLLINHLISEANIEKAEAAKQVKDFVEQIQKQLTNEKSFLLEGIGSLYYDEDNKIQFRTASGGISSTSKVEAPVKKEDSTKSESAPTIIIPEVETSVKEENIVSHPQKPKVELIHTVQKSVERPRSKEIPKPIVSHLTKEEEPAKEKKQGTTKLKWASIYISIIALSAAALAIFFIYNDKPTKIKPISAKEKISKVTPDTNKVQSAPLIKEQPKAESSAPQTLPPKSNEGKPRTIVAAQRSSGAYYLVAGCFSIEDNADKLVQKLTEQGFNSEKFLRQHNLHCVSFLSCSSKNEALIELRKIKAKGYSDVWILRK